MSPAPFTPRCLGVPVALQSLAVVSAPSRRKEVPCPFQPPRGSDTRRPPVSALSSLSQRGLAVSVALCVCSACGAYLRSASSLERRVRQLVGIQPRVKDPEGLRSFLFTTTG